MHEQSPDAELVRVAPAVGCSRGNLRLGHRPDRQHPARPAAQGHRRRRGAGVREGRVLQPRRLGQGPHRAAHGRRGRARGPARSPAARSSSRRRATPAWASRSSRSSAATRASSSCPTRSARTRSTCSRRTAPRSSCARRRCRRSTPTRTTTSATGWRVRSPARGSPTSTPTRTTRCRTTSRPVRSCGGRPTGAITHFVAGVGTGGTITGTGRYLKEVSEGRVQIIGADPEGSVYSGGTGRPYLVEGSVRTSGRRRTTRRSSTR